MKNRKGNNNNITINSFYEDFMIFLSNMFNMEKYSLVSFLDIAWRKII